MLKDIKARRRFLAAVILGFWIASLFLPALGSGGDKTYWAGWTAPSNVVTGWIWGFGALIFGWMGTLGVFTHGIAGLAWLANVLIVGCAGTLALARKPYFAVCALAFGLALLAFLPYRTDCPACSARAMTAYGIGFWVWIAAALGCLVAGLSEIRRPAV